MKKYGDFYATIGLEIHIALQTKKKSFSSTINDFNVSNFSLFDIGMPGILPVLSEEPVKMAAAFALSVGSKLQEYSEFERKHYFYPDLPLGYQITQQNKPIMIGGTVPILIDNEEKIIQIEHAHLECDAAKSIHDKYHLYTAIDISRCASPLLEVVSMPCMHSPEEAKEYAKTVHSLVSFLGICDGKMEEGSFRVDASISLCKDTDKLGTRVEIKNISSFSFLQSALIYEIKRQSEVLNSGSKVVMETRLFDEATQTTKSMRLKETVDEYRYMPDPDILPLYLEEKWVKEIPNIYIIDYFQLKKSISKLLSQFGIEIEDSQLVILLKNQKDILQQVMQRNIASEKLLRLMIFWLPEVFSKAEKVKDYTLEDILKLSDSSLEAKEIKETLNRWIEGDKRIEDYIPSFIPESEVMVILREIISDFPTQVSKYKGGELKMIQFLIGKAMALLKGKAPATTIKSLMETILKE